MESSLRNHALVQQQNQQQQWNREEYYRNTGIMRNSATGSAPVASSHHSNNSANNMNSNRSRNSGSSTSGKGSRASGNGSFRSASTRSGEASDEAVQGALSGLLPQHRYHNKNNPQHHQQEYQYQHQQQQRYPQHHQYYNDTNINGMPQQQQQQHDQYGYPIHRDTISSSQQSSSHHYQYIDQQQQQHYGGHAGGSAAESISQSHYSNILGSVGGSMASNPTVEEAYRKVGMRLSLSVHGGDSDSSRPPIYRARIDPPRLSFMSPSSSFMPFKEALQNVIRQREKEDASSGSSSGGSTRSKKNSNGNFLRKMTLNANELFRFWHTEHSKIQPHPQRRRRKSGNASGTGRLSSRTSKPERSSGREEISPHRRIAQMSLGDNSHIYGRGHNSMMTSSMKKQPGSLSAVIESASQNSSTATRSTTTNSRHPRGRGDEGRSVRSDMSRASSTIATDTSFGTRNSLRSFGTLPPRGKCLTHPSEGVSNENLCDNMEGNLIVHENDNIYVPKKQVCTLTKGKIPRGAPSSDFRVQSLLGQGTFAQVFRCLHVQTGQLVAVKIVKNKPAYTRQAAVEIDVIRALTADSKSNGTSNATEGPSHKNGSDYMIDMVCYFLYKDHLCLVFELLGLNLYEVLKRRQFRGLPLSVTQTLVRQAVLGARTLAQGSIVHCDLKPENILLVDEDDSESVMSAGESKRVMATKQQTNLSEGNNKSQGNDHSNENQTQSTDKSKSINDTASINIKNNVQEEKSQTGQTHLSGNSKSTAETNNTRTKNEEQQQQQKSNGIMPHSKSPMESTIATNETNEIEPNPGCSHQIKLIDFGSACFEGQMSHTYIQSRFYRSPEVLLGLAYDSAIDMWSLGCVAAELFLGLPILPGVHEHDQLLRIIEMIGDTPDWMLDQGTKSSKYFVKYVPSATPAPSTPSHSSSTTPEYRPSSTEASSRSGSEAPRPLPQWRIKTQHEYIASLSNSDIKKKGGLAKLQKQPGSRYFKRKFLSDIILHKGQSGKQEDSLLLKAFIHFLYGILDPDPWKRWTAFQVASHPFFTGATMQKTIDTSKIKDGNQANRLFNFYWEAPSDPTIYRRKLLNVQKTREKQQAARRGFNRGHTQSRSRSVSPSSQDGLFPTVRNSFSETNNHGDDTHSFSNNMDEATNNAGARVLLQGSYQGSFNMSSSITQFGSNPGIRLLGYGSGAQPGFSGPQSFSESGNSVGLSGSYNEVDFALALHRPGVVPMGDSVTTATTSTTSMSSGNNSRSSFNQSNHQMSLVGSYGSHQVLHSANHQRRFATGSVHRTCRSFGEGDLAPADSSTIPTVIDSRHQQALYSSSQETGMGIGLSIELKPQVEISADLPIEHKDENTLKRPESATNTKNACHPHSETINSSTDDNSTFATNPKSQINYVQPNQNLGVYDSQHVYQQQLAAMQQQFQQQQLLLQQQQAALALQQEQLRVYYSNMSNAAGMNSQQFVIPGPPSAAINAQQFGIPGASTNPASNISNAVDINAQQFGIAKAAATPTDSMNTQQFGVPVAQATPSTTINAQQFGLNSYTQGTVQAASLNPQHFGLAGTTAPIQGGGYYVVQAADGTHMIMPSNQGLSIPMSGQVSGISSIPNALPGQLQGLHAGPSQIQGLTPIGLPSVGGPLGSNVTGMPGIQGIQAGGMIPPVESVPGVGSAGMGTIPTINNNTSPGPTGMYPQNNNQQQHHPHQP